MPPPILKVDSVELAFGDRKILQDIYLYCKQGEIVGLLGRNGSGKTCLLKIIFGTLTPAYKHISIDDQYIYKGFHQCKIAYLPQHNYLPKGIKIRRLAQIMVTGDGWEVFSKLQIYKDYQHKTTEDVSGGELRQLEMLMILHSSADFILMDEPFTHISPVQTDAFKQILKEAAKTKGIIVTDHQYYNIIDVSNRLILLNNGYTKQITHPDELVAYGYLSSH